MKLRFKSGVRLYLALALSVIVIVFSCIKGYDPVFIAVAVMSLIFIGALEITLEGTVATTVLLPLAFSVFSFASGQIMVDVGFSSISLATFICNLVLIALLYYLVLLALPCFKAALPIVAVAFFVLHIANYALLQFRGRELALSDFYSFKNAAGVASSYSLVITPIARSVILLLLLACFLVFSARLPDRKESRHLVRMTSLGCAAFCAVGLFFGVAFSKNYLQTYGSNGARFNGMAYNLIVEMRESRVKAPEGYSAERVEKILSRYETVKSEEDTPHVIVIMNEALSDLSVLGDIEMNTEPMPFFNSLTENTVRGYALASVLGGNTATSEWEFLTGNSAAFIPNGAVAYQQYVKNHIWSIVDTLKREDYTAVAMHPYLKTFWKRDSVYSLMGFDETYFIDELTTDDKLRGFVTDRAFYGDIIDRFEGRAEGEKLFVFGITMQNHGSYKWNNFETTVTAEGGRWSEVDQYLTLTSISDDAFRELVEYFEKVDERVVIAMFGDHQPSFSDDFYISLFGEYPLDFDEVQKKQTVPFVIWANYDIEEKDDVETGLNSLGGIVLDTAGISLPPYQAFLADMRNIIPTMNAYGYYSNTLNRQARTYEATGEEDRWLLEYRMLQYNNLFDRKGRLSAFDTVKK